MHAQITPCPYHKAFVMSIQGVGRPRGPGYWKLNVSVLNEELYREGIRDISYKRRFWNILTCIRLRNQ